VAVCILCSSLIQPEHLIIEIGVALSLGAVLEAQCNEWRFCVVFWSRFEL